jgi:hypothetical protein
METFYRFEWRIRMTDCEHDFDAFQLSYETPAVAWTHAECALCMLRLLHAMFRKYSNCYPAAADVLKTEEFMQMCRALRTFVALVNRDLIQEQIASFHMTDTVDLDLATSLERAISILMTQAIPNAVLRPRIRLRNELSSLDSHECRNVGDLATQLDDHGRKASDELLKQYSVHLREIMSVNPCSHFQFVIGIGGTR